VVAEVAEAAEGEINNSMLHEATESGSFKAVTESI